MWVKKNVVRKFFWVKKMWVKKKVGQKKIWVKKNLGQIFFVHESSSWVKIGLHAENQLPGWSGSGLKVTVLVGWVLTHNLVKPTYTWLG